MQCTRSIHIDGTALTLANKYWIVQWKAKGKLNLYCNHGQIEFPNNHYLGYKTSHFIACLIWMVTRCLYLQCFRYHSSGRCSCASQRKLNNRPLPVFFFSFPNLEPNRVFLLLQKDRIAKPGAIRLDLHHGISRTAFLVSVWQSEHVILM